MKIENLYPERVFYYFKEISKVPRGSAKEQQISDWLVNFAKEKKLEVIQDKDLNVIIKKPATKGYEEYEPLILQGHMDMVWEKNKGVDFNFETDGIKLLVEDGYMKADGTTLGADNGIAVAMALAILESDVIKHPALEVLITTDEEETMNGAENVDFSLFKSSTLLNLDTEEYGEIYVSSAGGSRLQITRDYDALNVSDSDNIYSIEISGLCGGHSGMDISLNIGNANKILTEVLLEIKKSTDFNLINFRGGEKNNAIPRESVAYITIDTLKIEEIDKIISETMNKIVSRYENNEPNIKYELNKISKMELNENEAYEFKMTVEDTTDFLNFLNEYPNGVKAMSKNIEGLVQTSLNQGVVRMMLKKDGIISINVNSLLRSSSAKELKDLEDSLEILAKKYGASSLIDAGFYPWEYKEVSPLRELFIKAFKEYEGKEPELKAVHAGLECGIFVEKKHDLDVISIGPNIFNPHSPDEKMEIESVAKTWDYLLKALEMYDIKK